MFNSDQNKSFNTNKDIFDLIIPNNLYNSVEDFFKYENRSNDVIDDLKHKTHSNSNRNDLYFHLDYKNISNLVYDAFFIKIKDTHEKYIAIMNSFLNGADKRKKWMEMFYSFFCLYQLIYTFQNEFHIYIHSSLCLSTIDNIITTSNEDINSSSPSSLPLYNSFKVDKGTRVIRYLFKRLAHCVYMKQRGTIKDHKFSYNRWIVDSEDKLVEKINELQIFKYFSVDDVYLHKINKIPNINLTSTSIPINTNIKTTTTNINIYLHICQIDKCNLKKYVQDNKERCDISYKTIDISNLLDDTFDDISDFSMGSDNEEDKYSKCTPTKLKIPNNKHYKNLSVQENNEQNEIQTNDRLEYIKWDHCKTYNRGEIESISNFPVKYITQKLYDRFERSKCNLSKSIKKFNNGIEPSFDRNKIYIQQISENKDIKMKDTNFNLNSTEFEIQNMGKWLFEKLCKIFLVYYDEYVIKKREEATRNSNTFKKIYQTVKRVKPRGIRLKSKNNHNSIQKKNSTNKIAETVLLIDKIFKFIEKGKGDIHSHSIRSKKNHKDNVKETLQQLENISIFDNDSIKTVRKTVYLHLMAALKCVTVVIHMNNSLYNKSENNNDKLLYVLKNKFNPFDSNFRNIFQLNVTYELDKDLSQKMGVYERMTNIYGVPKTTKSVNLEHTIFNMLFLYKGKYKEHWNNLRDDVYDYYIKGTNLEKIYKATFRKEISKILKSNFKVQKKSKLNYSYHNYNTYNTCIIDFKSHLYKYFVCDSLYDYIYLKKHKKNGQYCKQNTKQLKTRLLSEYFIFDNKKIKFVHTIMDKVYLCKFPLYKGIQSHGHDFIKTFFKTCYQVIIKLTPCPDRLYNEHYDYLLSCQDRQRDLYKMAEYDYVNANLQKYDKILSVHDNDYNDRVLYTSFKQIQYCKGMVNKLRNRRHIGKTSLQKDKQNKEFNALVFKKIKDNKYKKNSNHISTYPIVFERVSDYDICNIIQMFYFYYNIYMFSPHNVSDDRKNMFQCNVKEIKNFCCMLLYEMKYGYRIENTWIIHPSIYANTPGFFVYGNKLSNYNIEKNYKTSLNKKFICAIESWILSGVNPSSISFYHVSNNFNHKK